jgi:hypothetical protein
VSESLKVKNAIEVVNGDSKVLLLESSGSLKEELKFSLKCKG